MGEPNSIKRGLAGSFITATAAVTTRYGQFVDIDTTGGAFTVTLPADPDHGDHVEMRWKAGTALPTVSGNGKTLNGAGTSLTLSLALKGATLRWRYDAGLTTWVSTQNADIATVRKFALLALVRR